MLASLMTPGGRLGYATVAVAFLLAVAGVVAIILGASGIGIEKTEERIGAAILGSIALLGVAGLVLQPRRPALGATLAVAGSITAAILNGWAIVPILIVPATIAIVVMRSRRLTRAGTSLTRRTA